MSNVDSFVMSRDNSNCNNSSKRPTPCPELPGTILRIFIPAGAVINFLNLIEVASPSGVCLIVRIPLLGDTSENTTLQSLINAVQQAGGSIQFGD